MLKKKTHRLLKKQKCLNSNQHYAKCNIMGINLIKNMRCFAYQNIIYSKRQPTIFKGGRNICSLTGKYRSVFNCLKLSRHSVRFFADTSNLANYSKLSWLC